jgi:hypothetical protein
MKHITNTKKSAALALIVLASSPLYGLDINLPFAGENLPAVTDALSGFVQTARALRILAALPERVTEPERQEEQAQAEARGETAAGVPDESEGLYL